MSKYFAKKSLASLQAEAFTEGQHTLKRQLGATNLVLLGIGAIIGAGLFSLTGLVAYQNAGPAVTISLIVSAIGCAFAGLCYAEFASMIPVAGSAYTYSYATLGRIWAWVIGWDLVLEYAVGAATVSISWSQYLRKLLGSIGIVIPERFVLSPFEGGIINLPAVGIVILLSLLLIRGMKQSASFNAVIVIVKVAIVILFIVLGWQYMLPENHVPFIPENTGEFGHYGWTGILRGAGVVFFAYIGFDAVSTAAQEAKNPQRDMPIGIIGSLIICTILYVLFSYVMTGLANYKEFGGSVDSLAPVAIAIEKTPYHFLTNIVIIGILAGYSSVILVMLMGQSRVFYSMSKDGLLPPMFSKVHPDYQTPYQNNLFFMVIVGLFAGFIPGSVVGELTSIGTLFAFVLVCIGVIIMRRTMPDAPRAFKVPWVPVIPILGILVCLGLMAFLPLDTWIRLIVWMILGMIIFFTYSMKHVKDEQ